MSAPTPDNLHAISITMEHGRIIRVHVWDPTLKITVDDPDFVPDICQALKHDEDGYPFVESTTFDYAVGSQKRAYCPEHRCQGVMIDHFFHHEIGCPAA